MSNLPRICSFESRRQQEMSSLLKRHGAEPDLVPSLREIPIEENQKAAQACSRLIEDPQFGAIVIFQTGVGATAWIDLADCQGLKDSMLNALRQRTVVARGPKPYAVLHKFQIPVQVRVAAPHTSDAILLAIQQAKLELKQRSVIVLEYGEQNLPLANALADAGAHVESILVYRWGLPADLGPLCRAIRNCIAGKYDCLLFTSAQQVRNVLSVAQSENVADEWRRAASQTLIGSIGPTTTKTLHQAGLTDIFEASQGKMGVLVREACAKCLDRRST